MGNKIGETRSDPKYGMTWGRPPKQIFTISNAKPKELWAECDYEAERYVSLDIILKCSENDFCARYPIECFPVKFQEHLVLGVEYEMIIATMNPFGEILSDPQHATAFDVPSKPRIIAIETKKPLELVVKCDYFKATSKAIQAICQLIVQTKDSERIIEIDETNVETPIVVKTLSAGIEYTIVAVAKNELEQIFSDPETAIPLEQPPKPVITKICHGKSGELYIDFKCMKNINDKAIQGKFHLMIEPPIDYAKQNYAFEENSLLIEQKSEEKIDISNYKQIKLKSLNNGTSYKFTLSAINSVGCSYSEPEYETPLNMPLQPIITDLLSKPNTLKIHFDGRNAQSVEIQATFEIIVEPEIDETNQNYPVNHHRLLINNDRKPITIRDLRNGVDYTITVASVNSVGRMLSESRTAAPLRMPPKPVITDIFVTNPRELRIDFEFSENMYNHQTQAKVELLINPSVDGKQKYQLKRNDKSIRLNNLINGMKYKFNLVAINLVGEVYSDSKYGVPLQLPPK
eukprot:137053_1